jgi:hypothetical protein
MEYSSAPIIQPTITEAPSGSPQQVNFTAQYNQHPSAIKDKLEEFRRLLQQDFDTCDPIPLWAGRCEPLSSGPGLLQFPGKFISPCLNVFAESPVLFIQGSAAAVECIFPVTMLALIQRPSGHCLQNGSFTLLAQNLSVISHKHLNEHFHIFIMHLAFELHEYEHRILAILFLSLFL